MSPKVGTSKIWARALGTSKIRARATLVRQKFGLEESKIWARALGTSKIWARATPSTEFCAPTSKSIDFFLFDASARELSNAVGFAQIRPRSSEQSLGKLNYINVFLTILTHDLHGAPTLGSDIEIH